MKNGKIESDMSMEKFRELSDKQIQNLGLRTLSPQNLKAHENTFVSDKELTLNNFTFSYGKNPALNIELQNLPLGGIIAVIGHNGAGKSTFSKCLCGLEKPFKGKVLFGNVKYGRKDMLRKSYIVMQDVNHQLFCETVEDEIMLGMSKTNCGDVKQILESLDLIQFSQRHPMSLSGGQKQRVAVASALLANKEFLIFDEPTSGLDYKNMKQTAALISSLKGRKTVFIVTHDPELIVRCCTHILHLENGKVSEFYPLNKESSEIGGVDIRDFPTEEYNRKVAYVSQENFLFDDTIRENIRMGNLNASDEEVEKAAKKCGCHQFIMELANGYDTVVGGACGHLSGGERQRISIARAMLKNAPIVILDEATAYTDPENEAVIQSSVAKLVKGKTLIVIAHRLSTIADADKIFIISDGQVAEQGTHKELLKSGKIYPEMWKTHISVKDTERESAANA